MSGKYRIRIIDRYGEKRFYPEVKGVFGWSSIVIHRTNSYSTSWALTESEAVNAIEKHKLGVKVTDKYL